MKTEVIFSFDTEDYTTQRNADAILALANMLTEEGVRGHFAVVGYVAKQLLAWGRQDVIKAMEPHVLGYHSCSHSMHPVMAEMSDIEDFNLAYQRVAERESEGLELLHKTFGDKKIWFAVPPGNDTSYTAQYFYASQGIPYYFGGYINNRTNTLVDYCSLTQIPYSMTMESEFMGDNPSDVDALLDRMSTKHHVIFYHHPNMSVKKVFWDILNYNGRNRREFGDWIEAEDRTLGETVTFWSRFRALIRRLKADDRFIITDAEATDATYRKQPCIVTKQDLAQAVQELKTSFGPTSASLAVSDVFYALAAMLTGKSYQPGLIKGMLQDPQGIASPVTVSRDGIVAAAKTIAIGDFIAPKYIVDGKAIGPADLLFAMAEVLLNNTAEITLTPRPQTVDLSDYPELNRYAMRGTWVFSPDFKDEYLSKRLRLQAWTLRDYHC